MQLAKHVSQVLTYCAAVHLELQYLNPDLWPFWTENWHDCYSWQGKFYFILIFILSFRVTCPQRTDKRTDGRTSKTRITAYVDGPTI